MSEKKNWKRLHRKSACKNEMKKKIILKKKEEEASENIKI